ncbi:MAG: hypothetical protein ACRC2R_18410 [Xenococcaceae cyanobacterium]
MDYYQINYYIPQPPFLILVFGLFIGIACGLSFEAILRQRVYAWSKNPVKYQLDKIQDTSFVIPFWGICLGIWIFLAGGLEIFNVESLFAFAIALPLTIFTAGLVWSQLIQVLKQLEKGGSKALDLDAFNF